VHSAAPMQGRRALPRSFVEHHQRRRAASALAELAHQDGIAAVTTEAICRQARMSRTTFYTLFPSVASCRAFAFEEAYEQLFGELGATAAGEPWPAALRAALDAFFAAIGAEPFLAELCLVHCFGAGAEAREHDYEAGVRAMSETMRGARLAAAATMGRTYLGPPAMTEELLARGVVSLAALQVGRGETAVPAGQREEMVALVAAAFPGSE
jgi:AcrR family transcriptional regulator